MKFPGLPNCKMARRPHATMHKQRHSRCCQAHALLPRAEIRAVRQLLAPANGTKRINAHCKNQVSQRRPIESVTCNHNMQAVSGREIPADADESGREDLLFFEESLVPCAKRHATATGASVLEHAGGSSFVAAHARKIDHRASCVAALSSTNSTPTRSSDMQSRRSTHLNLFSSAITHASTTLSAGSTARAASVRVPSRKESDMLSQRNRESIIQELKRDHKRICLSMDELLNMEDDEAKAKRLSKPVASAIAILAGVFGIMQVGINTTLRRVYVPSALAASATSFCVGTGVMLIISTLHKLPRSRCSNDTWKELRSIPWYAYTGGLLGAAYVTTTILIAPVLGFAAFKIAATSGQLISGIICDAVGFLHLSSSPPTPFRMLCTAFVLLGAILCAKWSDSSGNEWQVPVYLLLSALAGSVFPIQACVNYELGRHLGTPYRAVAANFIVGAIALWVCVAIEYAADPNVSLPIYQSQEGETMHWWAWTGGLFGALLICGITLGIPALGAVGFTLIFVSTQLIAAVVAGRIRALFSTRRIWVKAHYTIYSHGFVLSFVLPSFSLCTSRCNRGLRIYRRAS